MIIADYLLLFLADAMCKVKYKIEQYAKQLGKFETVIPINPAWYLENFLSEEVAPVFGGFPHFPDEEGYLTFRVPHWGGDNRVLFLGVHDDFGDIVQGIFLDPARYNEHVVHGASHMRTFDQLTADFEDGRCYPVPASSEVLACSRVHSDRKEASISTNSTIVRSVQYSRGR